MKKILVVDDSPIDRKRAGELLTRTGHFYVEFASNGLEALEHLEGELPLLLVTDLQMPEMDGLELVRRVRAEKDTMP